ncbi:hypothetical protein BDQ17DRAFT_1344564 [Cyathus striatus]|nr:hypothetical protein BDQ17DRAFT_1344564 [Cyathus striatus]
MPFLAQPILLNSMSTLLELFLNLASDPATSGRTAVECCNDLWTYDELHSVTSVLAAELFETYGSRPTVAVISENHPYYLALILAVWKLGGAVAPLDCHAPSHLMKAMLQNMSPTFTAIPRMDVKNIKLAQDINIRVHVLGDVESTISSLTTHILNQKSKYSSLFIDPSSCTLRPEDVAIYLHTSSATSTTNLKCVPMTHELLISDGRGQRDWFQRNLSMEPMYPIRMLGWSPFSHGIGISVDLVPSILLTGGCYIFAVTPPGYAQQEHAPYNVPKAILEAILVHEPDVFAAVPWILDGIMHAYNAEHDPSRRTRIISAFKKFKYYISSGAATPQETADWAREQGLPTIIGIGMTETGGIVFHSFAQDVIGGFRIGDSCVRGAVYTLVDEDGVTSDQEGELYISSKYIAKGYFKHESSSFTEDDHGIITFRTGDIYCYGSSPDRIIWKGRKDDFIQFKSGESLDPRPIEQTLNRCDAIAHSCVVGNTFLSGPADFTCAILQLTGEALRNHRSAKLQISKVLASINGSLPPPLRISWSRILLLPSGQAIPYTKKGVVFRKKIQSLFGEQLEKQLLGYIDMEEPKATRITRTQNFVSDVILDAVSGILGIELNDLRDNLESSFAELGMDSAMAIKIVNKINQALDLTLPPNTCHIYPDIAPLTKFLCEKLSINFNQSPMQTPVIKQQVAPMHEPIVIVGRALRLPGDINDSASFWQALVDRRTDILTSTPEDRWDHKSFVSDSPGQITFSKSGFVDIASFDNAFFGIPGSEALFISPATRLALEASFEALENANIALSTIKGSDMGVFVATGLDTQYGELLFQDRGYEAYSRFYGTGVIPSTTCGRISYLLDIHGPSTTVETACSGGMVALDQAVRHLQSGRGESAIVTAVNTHTMPGMFGFLSAQQMTSKNSRSATFTNEADGYATSEGVVSLIVKTQSAAERDGDIIIGVIRSTDTRHNGRTQGLVAPSISAQVALQRSVLRLASLEPSDINFMETHGTGTSLGDLMEIQAINEVFQNSHTPLHPLVLGAAKSCIGHTETASGLVGIVKTLESFARNAIPGLTHLNEHNMNPAIDTNAVPLHIPCRTYALEPRLGIPHRALVVAYGFAGTISATVIEAPGSKSEAGASRKAIPDGKPLLFVVSAKSEHALISYIKKYISFCRSAPEALFQSICYTSCVGREHYRHRFTCVADNLSELSRKLEDRLHNLSGYAGISNPRVLFGFPGQGTHFDGMARDLANAYSGFRTILTKYTKSASKHTDLPILALLLGTDESVEGTDQSEAAQICIYVFQCAVTAWLKDLGLRPSAVLGNSLGEISAAVTAGALQYADGLRLVIARAHTLKSNPPSSGAMAAIAAPEQVILGYIDSLHVEDRVVLAVSNGEESHVISGFSDAVELVYQTAKMEGRRCAKLKVHQGFHSPSIEPGLVPLGQWLLANKSSFGPLKIPFYSTSTTEMIPSGECLPPEYWIAHARNPVKFWQTARKLNQDDTVNIFLDVGPQSILWSHMQGLHSTKMATYATTGKQGSNQEYTFLQAIAQLFERNVFVDLKKLYHERGHFSNTSIPTYPFQHHRHYPNFVPSLSQMQAERYTAQTIPLLSVNQTLLDLLYDHRIEGRRVLPGIAFADLAAKGIEDCERRIGSIRFHQPLVLEKTGSAIQAEIQKDGTFIIYYGVEKSKICSGSLVYRKPAGPRKAIEMEAPPLRVLNREAVYASFEDQILFGPAFQNIKNISVWPNYIQAAIHVPTSSNTQLDRIRKLDPCLHMFGAIFQFMDIPDHIHKDGLYLPTALQGFILHSETIPSEFYCRYYLPAETGENYTTSSVSFDVFSLSGDLLISCEKYLVARLPKGVAIQTPAMDKLSRKWMQNTWRREDVLQGLESPSSFGRGETVAYFSDSINNAVLSAFVTSSSEVFIGELAVSDIIRHIKTDSTKLTGVIGSPALPDKTLTDELEGKKISIVLDITRYHAPGSDMYVSLWKHAMRLMKFALSGKVDLSAFVVVSSLSLPTGPAYCLRQPPGIGAVLQGMLRVYRRESGLSTDTVWGVDLPDQLTQEAITEILSKEIHMHNHTSTTKSTVAAYRRPLGCHEHDSIVRIVPVLLPKAEEGNSPTMAIEGLAVIVGMGSIGHALARYLASSGCMTIVFLGRRRGDDNEIVQGLQRLMSSCPSATMEYVQADVTDVVSLRVSIEAIVNRFGEVKHVVYTAGVIRDATISTVTNDEFASVLDSKAMGAWNLHLISQEMKLNLDTFVLLSSISVPLGNAGQVAYVAGNAFLDSLAAHRRSIGLPGTSLQLGAWESKVIENVDLSQTDLNVMSHAEGIPLVLKAIFENDPVQVIVSWNAEKLARSPPYASDAMFRELRLTNPGKVHVVQKTYSKKETSEIILSTVKGVLEIRENDPFDPEESLVSCGMDSISFAQMRGNVLQRLGIEIPVRYLSNSFSVNKMMSDVCKGRFV